MTDFGLEKDTNVRWWLEEDPELRGKQLQAAFLSIAEKDRPRQDLNLHHLRLYGNLPVEGIGPSISSTGVDEPRVTLNIVANVCDYATNRIGRYQPLPRPLPVGAGNFTLRRKCKLLERFFEGCFRVTDFYSHLRDMFLDCTIFGTGILKVYPCDGEIVVENIFPSEILVDPQESLYRQPRTLYQAKWVSRDVLREKYLRDAKGRERARLEEILDRAGKNAAPDEFDAVDDFWTTGVNDQVLVVEAWHLRSGKKATDGRHIIAVDAGELFCEDWEEDEFPFLFLRWKNRPRSFWGIGLAEEVNGIQVEINRMLLKIQAAFQLLVRPLILLEAGSKVVKSHITNEIGAYVSYVGTKPEVWSPGAFPAEFYQHLERLKNYAYEIVGMSQDAVAPSFEAAESGIARQYAHDIETERFSIVAQNVGETVVKAGKRMVACAEYLSAHGGFKTVSQKDRHTIQEIDWDDIDLEADQYVLAVYEQSALPSLPGPRIDRVVMLMQAGLLDPATALRMINLPDTEFELDMARAASDNIDRIVENIMDEGLYEPPDPYMDLNLAIKKVQDHYNRAARDNAPEPILAALQKFLHQAHMLEQKAAVEQFKVAQMAAAGPGMAGALPPGPGAPPATGTEGAPPMASTTSNGVIPQ